MMPPSMVMLALKLVVGVGCGSPTRGEQLDPCRVIGHQLERRLAAAELDRGRVSGLFDAVWNSADLAIALSELTGTHDAAMSLGASCLAPDPPHECWRGDQPWSPSTLDDLFTRTHRLTDGFFDHGPCASEQRHDAPVLCRRMGRDLGRTLSNPDMPEILDAWAGDAPSAQLSWLQLGAQEHVGRWRALLDYADDLVEVCVPENARAACTDLARRSASAHPRVIVAALQQLAGAFRYGTPCRPLAP
jgi:hypothetical protein